MDSVRDYHGNNFPGRFKLWILFGCVCGLALLFTARQEVKAQIGNPSSNSALIFTVGNGTLNTGIISDTFTITQGSSTAYVTNWTTNHVSFGQALWEGTAQTFAGYGPMAHRVDLITQSGVDVQSSVAMEAVVTAHSNNSGGTANDTRTAPVAVVASCSDVDATSSASCYGATNIAISNYTGAIAHTINAVQNLVASALTPGMFGGTSSSYTVGASEVIQSGSAFGGSIGNAIDSSQAAVGWLFGDYVASTVRAAHAVVHGQTTPTAGYWMASASTYGMFIGCGTGVATQLFVTNTANNCTFASDTPTVGQELGPRAATSGNSLNIRFDSTTAGGADALWDLFETVDQNFHFQQSGADKLIIGQNGNLILSVAASTITAPGGLISSTFANLPAATNGTVYACSDCTTGSNPCTGASTGAVAVRQNGVWVCK